MVQKHLKPPGNSLPQKFSGFRVKGCPARVISVNNDGGAQFILFCFSNQRNACFRIHCAYWIGLKFGVSSNFDQLALCSCSFFLQQCIVRAAANLKAGALLFNIGT